MEDRHRRLLEADESMLAPPEFRKRKNSQAQHPGGEGSRRQLRAPREDLGPARPAVPASPFFPSTPGPSRDILQYGPVPFYFTFLGSYHEPPGMIRNTWPLGAAGAQEIRTLKLEKNQGRRLGKKPRFRGGSGEVLWGCFPYFLGRGRISCLLQAPRVHGSLGVHWRGSGRGGRGRGTGKGDGAAGG